MDRHNPVSQVDCAVTLKGLTSVKDGIKLQQHIPFFTTEGHLRFHLAISCDASVGYF